MAYFDGAYFSPTYFDTVVASAGGHRRYRPRRVIDPPAPQINDDEEGLDMVRIL